MKKLLIAACLMLGFTNAHALLMVDDDNGNFGTIPSPGESNEYLNFIGATSAFGCFGCNLFTNYDVELWYEILGSEAGFENSLEVDGSIVYTTSGDTDPDGDFGDEHDSFHSEFWGPGYLDFALISPLGTATNGMNPTNDDADVPNFFITIAACIGDREEEVVRVQEIDLGCSKENFFSNSEYLVFFDDAGADDDDNHDDLVVRITAKQVVKVPEASSLALLGLGLVGLGFARRRV